MKGRLDDFGTMHAKPRSGGTATGANRKGAFAGVKLRIRADPRLAGRHACRGLPQGVRGHADAPGQLAQLLSGVIDGRHFSKVGRKP
jgi:hypothetical protein